MPKLPMDYSKCCIYKIEHVDDDSLVYVGHTTNFDKRKWNHKNSCCNDNDKQYNLKVYQMIRENGGWDDFKMIEVEKYPCNDKREAERRESEIMKELKASMNTISSYSTEEETKEKKREYYKANESKIQEQKKNYYEANKSKIQEQRKIYNNEYREANKSKINAKVKCECGCDVVKRSLRRHQSTKRHLNIMKNLNAIIQ